MPNKNKLFLILTFVLTLVFAYLAKEASAQERIPLVISPARQQISANPGESYNLSLKFINESNVAITGNIRVVDFVVTEKDGSPTLLDDLSYPLSNQYSASTWFSLPYEVASIAANDVLRLNLKVNVPQDANPGGKYAAVYFESTGLTQQTNDNSSELSAISSRVVSLVSIRVNGEVSESAHVSALSVPSFVEFGPVSMTFDIFNKGDLHITPTGQITLTNWFNNEVDRQTLESKNIFPDSKREYKAEIGNTWMFGRYKVNVLASYGESGKTTQAQAIVWIIPITLILVITLSVVILVLSVVYISKKVTEKQKTLERKLEMEIDELESLKNKFKDKVNQK